MQLSRIRRVGLPVSDLERSVAWYREALGLTHGANARARLRIAFVADPDGNLVELLSDGR